MPHLSIDDAYRAERELSDRLRKAERDGDDLVKERKHEILEKGQRIEALQEKNDRVIELLKKNTKVDPELPAVKSSELAES